MKRIRSFLPYLKGSRALFALSLCFALLSTGSKLAIPFLAGKAVNLIKAGAAFDELSPYLILMCSFLFVGAIFRYGFDYIVALVGQRLVKNMRVAVYDSYLDVPVKKIDEKAKGDLLHILLSDIENVQTGLVSGLAALYDGVIAIIITIVFMAMLNWALALIVLFLTPLSMLVSRFVSKYNSRHFKAQASSAGALNAFVSESLSASEAVQTLAIEETQKEGFDALSAKYRANTFRANLGASIINPSTRLMNGLINATLILLGALFIIKHVDLGVSFDVGELSAFLTYAANFMQPFNEISDVVSEVDYALSSFERVQRMADAPKEDASGIALEKEVTSIEARHIVFSYDLKRRIIDDFDVKIAKGQKVAIVGPTGCGKTTLINLLLRFYDPQEGSFYLNDEKATGISRESLRSHIGMVLQDTWIFNGTVYENIAYAKKGASQEEVHEAARKAQAESFILRLPHGYDTFINDSSGLSVGEKQLICASRVMLLAPEIVILDEATSNIDVRTEKLLSASFDALMKGRTSLVVAHRLSTILSSDLILVLKEGRIIEKGSHAELMQKKGFYHDLYEAQFE